MVDKVACQATSDSTSVMSLFHASTAHEGVQRRLDFQETAGQSQRAAAGLNIFVELALLALSPT